MDIEESIKAKRRNFIDRLEQGKKSLQQAEKDLEAAKEEMKQIKEKTLPKALADLSLGTISGEELVKVKKRVSEHEELIRDFPFLLTGLQTEKARIEAEGKQFSWTEQTFKKYQALKEEIKESGISPTRVERLHGLAVEISREPDLNCLQDVKDFLDSMKQ